MAQFAASAFEGTEGDNLSTLDANWVKQSGSTGNAEIASGRARASSTASAHYYYNTAPASADYSASVEVYNPGTVAAGSTHGPSVRMAAGANTSYHARINGAGSLQLYKFVAGTATLLGSASKTIPASGTSAVLTISVSGSTIDVTWNGEGSPAISVTDTSITAAGYPGLRWTSATTPTDTVGWQGDNFSADEAGGGSAITVAGQSVTQATQSTAGAISQTHLLTGANCTQANQSSSAAVTQTHVLAGQSVTQANTSTAGAVGAVTPHTLTGADCSQANGSTAGAVTQTHLLAGAASQQANTSTGGAVSAVPVITLTGAACSQANTSASAPVTQTHVLMAAPVAVDHIASASAIVQTHMLAGANCSQVNASTAGAVSDRTGPGIDWSVTGARAIVPLANTRAIVAHFDAVAIVPAANTRAIVPASGDDMDPIKTVEQYRQDREVYEIDFDAKYLTQANDTAATLKAVGSDAGITVTPQVAVGGALSSGVVKLAVDDPTAVGEYKVWAQIATTAGRERTGVIVVRVDDL